MVPNRHQTVSNIKVRSPTKGQRWMSNQPVVLAIGTYLKSCTVQYESSEESSVV